MVSSFSYNISQALIVHVMFHYALMLCLMAKMDNFSNIKNNTNMRSNLSTLPAHNLSHEEILLQVT